MEYPGPSGVKRARQGSPPTSPTAFHNPPSLLSLQFPPLPARILPFSAESQQSPWPKFLVISSDPDAPGLALQAASPFLIEKSIKALVGTPQGVKRLRSGDILVECSTKNQSNTLLNLTKLGNSEINIKVSPHRTLNSSKGVINCPALRGMPDQEILNELKPLGVEAVKRLIIKKDNETKPTNTLFLNFNTPIRPTSIKIGFQNLKVSPFIPNPLRCYNCQRLGHGSRNCRSKARCANCSSQDHSSETCELSASCPNCKGPHPASARDCPSWQREKQIQKIKALSNLTYEEARKQHDAQPINIPSTKPSMAQVIMGINKETPKPPSPTLPVTNIHTPPNLISGNNTKSKTPGKHKTLLTHSISTQTDITWIDQFKTITPNPRNSTCASQTESVIFDEPFRNPGPPLPTPREEPHEMIVDPDPEPKETPVEKEGEWESSKNSRKKSKQQRPSANKIAQNTND